MLGSMDPDKRQMYEKQCALSEKVSHYIYVAISKVMIPCVTIPYVILSYFMYYIKDMGEDSFILPVVAW